jgi:ABC-type branched-subunit amino acid transport system substrate-binding protein
MQSFSRDVRTDEPFAKNDLYNVALGYKVDGNGRLLNHFNIGSTLDMSAYDEMYKFIISTLRMRNIDGGVQGYIVKPYVLNDGYIPYRSSMNARFLVDDFDITTFLLPFGSAPLQAYTNIIKKNNGAVLFPITGSPVFRRPEDTHIVHYRPSYPDEARALSDFIVSEQRARKIAIFYQDDLYGKPAFEAAKKRMKKLGVDENNILGVPYILGQITFDAEAEKIRTFEPSAIGFFSSIDQTRKVIRKMGLTSIVEKNLFGLSDMVDQNFQAFIKEVGLRMHVALTTPKPNSDIEIAQEYQNLMKKMSTSYDGFGFEAYIATSIFLHVLDNITPPFTPQKILRFLEGCDHYEFKGLTLTFNPETRDLGQKLSIMEIHG